MATRRKNAFQVYLSDREEQILNQAADNEGLSKSDIVRRLIRRLDFQLKQGEELNLDAGLIIEDHINNPLNPKREVINSRTLS